VQITSETGVELVLHDLGGSSEGRPLLIAHATGFCGQTYLGLAEALAEHGHVWALDFRGHGDSTRPPDADFSWSAMGRDARAALDAIAAEDGRPVVGVGHSMGGAALLVAELLRPGSLVAAYLFEPIVLNAAWPEGMDNPLAEGARRRRPSFPSRPDALMRYASRFPLSLLRADALAAYVTHGFADQPDGSIALKCAREDEAATFASSGKLTVDDVAHLRLPIAVGRGLRVGADVGPFALAGELADRLPTAALIDYAHLNHYGPLQDPPTIAEDVVALVARATAS
jgi:pimeloyl-ACP methyl ester carboxylesterase